jgi:dTDP-4-amino-4,6-dideoxygalactose transaminase
MSNELIHVNKVYLPNADTYKRYLDKIFTSRHLTNFGPLFRQLSERLIGYLDAQNLLLVNNGSMALHLAFRVLGIYGDVITTPFSFVATTSTLVWERLNPVFADIDPNTYNIDPSKIEALISPKTSAILATHVYGNPCDIDAIQNIADAYGLKVIYDAAHCFGTTYKGKSILQHGDASTMSFHSTKLFHTVEGGALALRDEGLLNQAKQMSNFGYEAGIIKELGTNFKMSELHAAMGLSILDEIDIIFNNRRDAFLRYEDYIAESRLEGKLKRPVWNNLANNVFSYYPVLFDSEKLLLIVMEKLEENNIFPRRYFYPSLDNLPYTSYEHTLPIAHDISSRVLSLPFYADIEADIQWKIINIIASCI